MARGILAGRRTEVAPAMSQGRDAGDTAADETSDSMDTPRTETGPLRARERFRGLEVAAVLATAGLHLVVSNVLAQQALFIGFALAAWTTYVVVRARRDPEALVRWGFTRNHLRRAWRVTSAVSLCFVALMAGLALAQGSLRWTPSLVPLLLLYPIWGLIQQFLVQALVAGNLRRVSGWPASPAFIVPACGVLFGLVHLPDVRLAGATCLLGLVFTPIYLRWGNLWPLGLWHGWLGAFCYVWVLGRDPWAETFG